MFKVEGEEIGVVVMFLAGEGKVFERLVYSVGENLIFGWMVICFFSWAFFLVTRLGPALK
jgi:hypothetical protein